MVARALAFFLLVAAALADTSGAHAAAFYFLLAAVPAIAVGALTALGELVETRGLKGKILGSVQALASTLALVLAIVIVGSRSGPLFQVPVPGLGFSALAACLGLFVLQAAPSSLGRTPAEYGCPQEVQTRPSEALGDAGEARDRRAA
jgi:peptidoglycan/LPS O-acetylase OafA/YrhL